MAALYGHGARKNEESAECDTSLHSLGWRFRDRSRSQRSIFQITDAKLWIQPLWRASHKQMTNTAQVGHLPGSRPLLLVPPPKRWVWRFAGWPSPTVDRKSVRCTITDMHEVFFCLYTAASICPCICNKTSMHVTAAAGPLHTWYRKYCEQSSGVCVNTAVPVALASMSKACMIGGIASPKKKWNVSKL